MSTSSDPGTARSPETFETRYQAILESAVDAIIIIDDFGNIVALNPAATRMFAYRSSELIGRNIRVLMNEAEGAVHDERLGRARRGRQATTIIGSARTIYGLRKDGSAFPIEISVAHWEVDGERFFTGILRDISDRLAMEAKLELHRREAEAAAVAKSEFLANMSHEIRTPLTAIVGYSDLVGQAEDLPPKVRQWTKRISAASRSLLVIVNDILDFSKLESLQIALDPRPFVLREFMSEAVDIVAEQAATKGLLLEVEAMGELPEAVNADSTRLRQILLNLLGNAIKFTHDGGVRVRVRHEPGADGLLHFEIKDQGVGIAPDKVDRLFKRFSQVDGSIAREFGGTGLGLAICKGLVELMGGEIGVESELGVGSTFWFTVRASEAEAVTEVGSPSVVPGEIDGGRILVVDDAPVNRELVRALLTPFNLELFEAANGQEAVEAAASTRYNLILMDMHMPVMDGIAATKAIRESAPLNSSTPILALSANVLPEHRKMCMDAGMADHIFKPIDLNELLSKVSYWLARS